MKNNPKNVSTPVSVILYLLAAIFLGYGIYMAYDAVVYVNTYDTNEAVSSTNMLQYVVAASASYFGFAIVIFAAASILGALNKVQRNLYQASAPVANDTDVPAEVAAEETADNAAGSDVAVEESEKIHEADDVSDAVGKTAEAPQQERSNDKETAPEEEEKSPEADSTVNADEPPAEPQEVPTEPYAELQDVPPVAELEMEETPEETSVPLVEDFSSQFITKTEKKPVSESTVKPHAPEIVVQQHPTPEIVIRKQPVAESIPQEDVSQRQGMPETSAEKPAANLQPTTVPEEILQSKRKRGLKYETVAMDGTKSDAQYPQNLSDTIRLKKEDRDAISSAFIRDIFEKNE